MQQLNINDKFLRIFSYRFRALKEGIKKIVKKLFRDTFFLIIYNFIIHIWKIRSHCCRSKIFTITVRNKYKTTHHNKYWSVTKKELMIKTSFFDDKQQLAYRGVFRTQSKIYGTFSRK